MGIREQLNQKPAITTGATIGILVLALGIIVYEIHGGSGDQYKVPTERYFSDDDGATYFKDSINRVPPFDHEGKQAVAASVFKCKSGKPFVGFLQRFTAKGLKAMTDAQSDKNRAQGIPVDDLQQNETEISPPLAGPKGWKKITARGAEGIMAVKCPDGGDSPDPVMP